MSTGAGRRGRDSHTLRLGLGLSESQLVGGDGACRIEFQQIPTTVEYGTTIGSLTTMGTLSFAREIQQDLVESKDLASTRENRLQQTSSRRTRQRNDCPSRPANHNIKNLNEHQTSTSTISGFLCGIPHAADSRLSSRTKSSRNFIFEVSGVESKFLHRIARCCRNFGDHRRSADAPVLVREDTNFKLREPE